TMVPNVKLIALLRDPVERCYSHWKERRRGDAEPLDFAAALAAEPDRLAGEEERLRSDPTYYSYPHEQQSYVAQSHYARALQPWIERFGQQNLLVLVSEEYYADPTSALNQVADFVGTAKGAPLAGEHRNAAGGAEMDPAIRAELRLTFAP